MTQPRIPKAVLDLVADGINRGDYDYQHGDMETERVARAHAHDWIEALMTDDMDEHTFTTTEGVGEMVSDILKFCFKELNKRPRKPSRRKK